MNMTKRILCLAMTVALLLGLATTSVAAESSDVKVNIYSRYDVNTVQFNNDLGRPFIDDYNRTLCPFRVVANFMGVQVYWDNVAREATFSRTQLPVQFGEDHMSTMDFTVRFTIDSNEIWTSYTLWDEDGELELAFDERSLMDTFPIIRNGRTYAPIRFLAEAFGYQVGWDAPNRTVMITSPDTEDWGQMMCGNMAQSNYQRVFSAREAEYWVDEYTKRVYGDGNSQYILDGTDSLVDEDGYEIDGWMFNFAPCDKNGIPTGERYDIFIGEGGETYYYHADEAAYLPFIGTIQETN